MKPFVYWVLVGFVAGGIVGCVYPNGGSGDDDDTCDADYHSDCAWDEFCYEEECQLVLGRRYVVTALGAVVGTTKPDGSDWDLGGGAPDLFANFGFDGDEAVTDTQWDSFSADWAQYSTFVLSSGTTFEFNVWDEDTVDHDLAAGVYWEGDDALVRFVREWGLTQTFSHPSDSRILMELSVSPDF